MFQVHHKTEDKLAHICKVCHSERSLQGQEEKEKRKVEELVAAGTTVTVLQQPEQPVVQSSLIPQPPDPRRIASQFLPNDLLKRAREFEAAGELCRWGYEVGFLNGESENPDSDLRIRPYGDLGKWYHVQVCGHASVSRAKRKQLKPGRCNAVMYFDEGKKTWVFETNSSKGVPKITVSIGWCS